MATVYQGHGEDGRQVALKVAREQSTGSYEPLRREASLLGRVDIQGISRLLEAGEQDGVPWYAMEYVAGSSLAELWAEPLATAQLDRWLGILARLCRPLIALHGQGIVHRDLNPRNIVVAEGDSPVIVDFGLSLAYAATSGRDLVAANPAFVGTVAYMSPEQLDGATLDSRSDIYSFGCLVYEAAAGRPPFAGSTQAAIQRRLDSVFESLADAAGDVPEWLCELVGGMLQKDLGRRIAYLSDVADVLSANGYGASPAALEVRPNLYRPRLTGRDEELGQVRKAMRQAEAGAASLILLGGESGIGKSRMVNEASRIAAHRGFTVVASSCKALDVADVGYGGSPLYPMRELLRAVCDYCMAGGEEAVARIFASRARVLLPYDERLALLPGIGSMPAPDVVNERAGGERALSTLTAMLRAFSMESPVFLAIDDIQWADEMTLDWLASLGDSFLHEARVLIIATYRSEEMSPALARLASLRHIVQLPLARLDGRSVSHMLADVLATRSNLPRELVRKVERDSEGIPFFVYEYLRAAVEGGFLTRKEREWVYGDVVRSTDPDARGLPMPSSVRDLLAGRVRSAGEEAFRVAQAASVVGRRFTIDDLVAITGDARSRVFDSVLQLERCEIVETDRDGHQFVHDKLREVAYGELPAERAARLHRRRAETIELATGEDARVNFAAELAFHWVAAGESGKALDYLVRGGEHAASRGAHGDAYRLLARALSVDARLGGRLDSARRARVLQLLGLASFNTSNLNASIRHSTEALFTLGESVPTSLPGCVAYTMAELARLLLPHAGTAERGALYDAAAAREQLGLSLLYQGSNFEGVAHLIGTYRCASQIDAGQLMIGPCVRLGFLAGTIRLERLSQRLFRRANDIASALNLPSGRGLTRYMEAEVHMGRGEWGDCQSKAMDAAGLFERVGDPQEAEMAWAIACNGFHYTGDFARAAEIAATILRSAEDRNHAIHIAWGQSMSARAMLPRGELEPALDNLLRARDNISSEPDLLSLVMTEGALIQTLVELQSWSEAARYSELLFARLCSSRRPMVPQCVDGYEGLVDGALSMWQRDAGNARLGRAARRACNALGGFAIAFPMAKPVYLRARARLAEIAGGEARARSLYNKSIEAARHLQTPLWEARAHQRLARIATDAATRDLHAQRAVALRQGVSGQGIAFRD